MKINHKIISSILIVIIILFLSIRYYDIIKLNNKIEQISDQIKSKNEIIETKNKEFRIIEDEKVDAISPEYYINSIMSYGLLENIEFETKINKSKFEGLVQLEIKFPTIDDQDKFKDLIVSLSLLGYVESVSKNLILLNVKRMSSGDAKKILSNSKTLK